MKAESGTAPDVAGFWSGSASPTAPVGQTVEITCAANPSYSYTLYLPKGHEGPYPVLINMSPVGRGKPLSVVSAESAGIAMIGLGEAKDGPWTTIVQNRAAALIDLASKVPIDWSRLHFSGFSGGARASIQGAMSYPGMTRGLICVGGATLGLDVNKKYAEMPFDKAVRVAFIAGTTDFNLAEARECSLREIAKGRSVWFETFVGPHSWGPQELLDRAAAWVTGH